MLQLIVTLHVLQSTVADRARTAQRRLRDGDTGATAVEYGLIIALIAAALIAGILFLSGRVGNAFNNTANAINN